MSSTTSTDMSGSIPANSSSTQGDAETTGLSTFTEISATPKVAISVSAPPRIDPQTADSILLREHLIQTLTVNGTEIFNANLLGALDPFRALMALPKVQDTVKHFAFIRGDIVVTVRVTPPGSCFGAMVFSAICEGGMDMDPNATVNLDYADDLARDSMYTSFNDMFQLINFEQACSVSLELPFVYHQHYVATNTLANWMWRLQLQSLVPLQSTISTTAAAEVKIYVAMKPGYQLAVPVYQSKKPVTNTAGFSSGKKKGAMSDIASQVSGLASSVAGAVPALAPFATPIAVGASAISAVASFFGFTRESSFVPPETYVYRLFASSALADGVDTSDSLVTLSGAALAVDPSIGDGEHDDLMCFESIRQRWGCVTTFTLTTSITGGQMVYSLPITPFYAGGTLGVAYLTPGGYYGLPFASWRGGMEYLIYIPSSQNMRGLLQVCYNPDVDLGPFPHAAPDPTGSVHTVSLDLSGTQQHVIQVPYASPMPCKKSYVIADGLPYGRGVAACNGSLDFYLSAAWVAPRTGVVSTRVIILARPMADMVYADVKTRIPELGRMAQSIAYQSTIDESVSMIETSILGDFMEQDFNLAQTTVTEVAPSARALVQKFSCISVSPVPPVTPVSPNFRMVQTMSPMTTTAGTSFLLLGSETGTTAIRNVTQFNWYKFYTMLFTGVRGGTRIKIVVASTTVDYTEGAARAIHYPNARPWAADLESQFRVPHLIYQPLSESAAVEITYPYVSDRLYLNPRKFGNLVDPLSGPDNDEGLRCIQVQGGPTFGPEWDLLVAGSSDCSVTRFRRVPGLVAALLVAPP